MNLSVNGQSKVPPGFRFHPTEEELLLYYLKKKVASEKIDLDVIPDIDLNKLEPWDIQEKCRIGSGSTPQNDWYLFSHKDKKYPTGTRTNRATAAGFWKATGRDKVIYANSKHIGMRKTLVFYTGRAPHGEKSDWIMHEYRLEDSCTSAQYDPSSAATQDHCMAGESWVVCRVFKKKNYQKVVESPRILPTSTDPKSHLSPRSKDVLDQILSCMGKTHRQENDHDPTASTGANNMIPTCCSSTENKTTFSNMLHERLILHNNDDKSPNQQLILNSLASDDHQYDLPPLTNYSSPSFGHDHDDIDLCYENQSMDEIVNGSGAKTTTDIDHEKPGFISTDWVTLDRLVASQLNGQAQEDSCIQTQTKQFPCFRADELLAANPSTTSSMYFYLAPHDEIDDRDTSTFFPT